MEATTAQLVAIGFLICGDAGELFATRKLSNTDLFGGETCRWRLRLVWVKRCVSAILTLYTGWELLSRRLKHLIED